MIKGPYCYAFYFMSRFQYKKYSKRCCVSDIGNTDQSKGDCIDEKLIDHCWFSLSRVFPSVSTQILNVTYDDDTVSNALKHRFPQTP